jgi:hypothetical protein
MNDNAEKAFRERVQAGSTIESVEQKVKDKLFAQAKQYKEQLDQMLLRRVDSKNSTQQ